MYVHVQYVCMLKFYGCLPNAGEMFLDVPQLPHSCWTASEQLYCCEWDCYWLENGVLAMNLATKFVCMHNWGERE